MNLFDETTLNDVFNSVAKEIKINDKSISAIVTNGALNKLDEQESKHLHTIDKVKQGDLVLLEGNKYLVITESMSKRHNKYKNIMVHCNMNLTVPGETISEIIGFDDFNRPMYKHTIQYFDVPSVLGFDRVGSALKSGVFLTIANGLKAKVQRNEKNLQYLTINKEIAIEGKTYKIR
ncbi:hypothetical protein AM499_06860 [Bacillus sp. FJAT-22090]|uniref:hypothetical protein n=1 Tax=Bacillus sp. FJAT-22090 TaxID=1581038 RepID=UPI0006AF1C28|nr:hypothetical protein [Bacillus sp. FJAT-22090]ALC85572.1 hypothetical protein AM499_06860 [Bacillus sp. FJAT-22090]